MSVAINQGSGHNPRLPCNTLRSSEAVTVIEVIQAMTVTHNETRNHFIDLT